jgi:hypothetical protein
MKWRLFRNKRENNLLLNLKDTKVVSRPMAVLFSLVTVFVCAALVFSVFLGGRWVYRRIANNDDNSLPTAEQVQSDDTTSPALPTPTATPTPSITLERVDGIPNTGPEPE